MHHFSLRPTDSEWSSTTCCAAKSSHLKTGSDATVSSLSKYKRIGTKHTHSDTVVFTEVHWISQKTCSLLIDCSCHSPPVTSKHIQDVEFLPVGWLDERCLNFIHNVCLVNKLWCQRPLLMVFFLCIGYTVDILEDFYPSVTEMQQQLKAVWVTWSSKPECERIT